MKQHSLYKTIKRSQDQVKMEVILFIVKVHSMYYLVCSVYYDNKQVCLRCTYGTTQFKLHIYTHVTLEFQDKFLLPLVTFTRANY